MGLRAEPTRAAGLCGPSPRRPAGSLSWPVPRFFCGPAGQALIAIPTASPSVVLKGTGWVEDFNP